MTDKEKNNYLKDLQNEIAIAEHAAIFTGHVTPLLSLKREYRRALNITTSTKPQNNDK